MGFETCERVLRRITGYSVLNPHEGQEFLDQTRITRLMTLKKRWSNGLHCHSQPVAKALGPNDNDASAAPKPNSNSMEMPSCQPGITPTVHSTHCRCPSDQIILCGPSTCHP